MLQLTSFVFILGMKRRIRVMDITATNRTADTDKEIARGRFTSLNESVYGSVLPSPPSSTPPLPVEFKLVLVWLSVV